MNGTRMTRMQPGRLHNTINWSSLKSTQVVLPNLNYEEWLIKDNTDPTSYRGMRAIKVAYLLVHNFQACPKHHTIIAISTYSNSYCESSSPLDGECKLVAQKLHFQN